MTVERFGRKFLGSLLLLCWAAGAAESAPGDRAEREERPKLRAAPSEHAPVVSLLSPAAPFVVTGVDQGWLEVEQGDLRGWLPFSSFSLEGPPPDQFCLERRQRRWLEWGWPRRFTGEESGRLPIDPEQIAADIEYLEKMKDLFYRHRYYQFYREWGPFFYRRTHVFYVQGVRLFAWCGDRLELQLAKRRLFYKTIFGPLWPDELIRAVVRSRPGIWGNEAIFGKGREYYLELAWTF